MDRVIPRRRGDGALARPTAGGWAVDAEHEWVVEGSVAFVDQVQAALARTAQRLSPTVLLLSFGNAVGRYDAGPLGSLQVRSGKWTDQHYTAMLTDVARWATALPFQAGAPSALPYARGEVDAPDVLYHAFVWLRHAVLEQPDAPLVGALRAILRDPHRRMVAGDRVVPVERACRLSPRALDDLASGRYPMRRVAEGRGLVGGRLFPMEIAERVARGTANTAENRFVKAFLASCGFVVDAMRRRMTDQSTALARRVRTDCAAIQGELEPILRHRAWEEVGRMIHFPAASTVLQRRAPYREVLRHHVLMRLASKALPLREREVVQLLEVKDIARLYELWTAFAVIEAIRRWLGEPVMANRVTEDGLQARLGSGLQARWADGTAIAYNASFSRHTGFHGQSWSRTLRPDLSLWVPRGPSAGLHLLDAKFRLLGSLAGDGPSQARPDDIHKMHAYRDAIPEARSAWVLYPGRQEQSWHPPGGETSRDGVGSVPVVPGEDHDALVRLVGTMLGVSSVASMSTSHETASPHPLPPPGQEPALRAEVPVSGPGGQEAHS